MTCLTRSFASFAVLSLLAACGGAVAPVGDSSQGDTSGVGVGSSSGGRLSCSPPACNSGDRDVGSSSSKCPTNTNCYSRSNDCGMTIWCAADIATCDAVPSCEPGYLPTGGTACSKSDPDCHTVTVCGQTIACTRPCEGPQPICDPGDTQVNDCPTDVYCYPRTVCGYTIYCIGGTFDGGIKWPPPGP